jgi:hypothetical protein
VELELSGRVELSVELEIFGRVELSVEPEMSGRVVLSEVSERVELSVELEVSGRVELELLAGTFPDESTPEISVELFPLPKMPTVSPTLVEFAGTSETVGSVVVELERSGIPVEFEGAGTLAMQAGGASIRL